MQKNEIPAPAWIEIDLRQYVRNLDSIWAAKSADTSVAVILKDNAYGHGAIELGKIAEKKKAAMLVVATLNEATELRKAGLASEILILGERQPAEIEECCLHKFSICAGSLDALKAANKAAARAGLSCNIHLKIDTGMSRYGFRWSETSALPAELGQLKNLKVEGVLSHFAMSDESDKTFAELQLQRFNEALSALKGAGLQHRWTHICNSGGLLDLPQAHFNLVRVGILALGVYPSKVCRRLEGIAPLMAVKARIAALKNLDAGDHVGYGMRFTAPGKMRIATLGLGYGWGFPRVRNKGSVLIHGKRAPIIGGVSMDAISVDVSGIPEAELWDEVVILGQSGNEQITINDLAELKNSVSYDAMTAWRNNLPRVYLG